MKPATVSDIKKELNERPQKELVELCLHLAKFKKENKELLTYLVYEAEDEEGYIAGVKTEMDELFEEINTNSYYFIKKSVRKILRHTKKYIRYSKNPETQVALMLHFCTKLHGFRPTIKKNVQLMNLFTREVKGIKKVFAGLHEDLQYDYESTLNEIENNLEI